MLSWIRLTAHNADHDYAVRELDVKLIRPQEAALPTGGGARLFGGLSVDTFLRSTTVQRLDRDALADIRGTVTTLAEAEGFEAHARSVEARFDGE